MKGICFFLLSTFFLALSSPDVEARKGIGSLFKFGRGVEAINGIKHYGSNVLTIEQLRTCLLLEQKLYASEMKLNVEQDTIRNQGGGVEADRI
jgi:hypothetical protein